VVGKADALDQLHWVWLIMWSSLATCNIVAPCTAVSCKNCICSAPKTRHVFYSTYITTIATHGITRAFCGTRDHDIKIINLFSIFSRNGYSLSIWKQRAEWSMIEILRCPLFYGFHAIFSTLIHLAISLVQLASAIRSTSPEPVINKRGLKLRGVPGVTRVSQASKTL
jgi:hypothetical protein